MEALTIKYSSDVYIMDEALLTTLALFYDKIYLPYPFVCDPEAPRLFHCPPRNWGEEEIVQTDYMEWKEKYQLLFKEGVLVNEPCPFEEGKVPDDLHRTLFDKMYSPSREQLRILSRRDPNRSPLTVDDFFSGKVTLALHALHTSLEVPPFFFKGDLGPNKDWGNLALRIVPIPNLAGSTEFPRSILAQAFFYRCLPKVRPLPVGDILKKRRNLAKYRADYMYYIGTKLDKLRDKVQNGVGPEKAAEIIWKEGIARDYHHFMRRKRVSFRWLSPVSRIYDGLLSIDANLMSSKFFFQLARAILCGADAVASTYDDDKREKYYAMKFIGSFLK